MPNSKIYLGSTNLGTGKIKLGNSNVSAIYLGANLLFPPSSPSTPTNVDYIHTSTGTDTDNFISTGIYPTTETYFRIVYKPNATIGSTVVGFDDGTTPTNCASDDTDYRYFYYMANNNPAFDFNSSRFLTTITFDADGYADITCGNNYINDNLTHTTTVGELQVTIAQGVPIYLNVSSDLDFRSLEIWDGNTKVYDAHAAELNGTYGIYESIGDTFISQTYGGNSMSGGNIQPDYLCFTAQQANSTVGYTSTLQTPPTIYKSTDGVNFTSWDGTAVTLSNIGDTLYVYGTNQTLAVETYVEPFLEWTNFVMTGRIAADGDVTYLLQNGGLSTLTVAHCLDSLFYNCTSLTKAPELPATTLASNCYAFMFRGCTGLTAAPTLPATTLAYSCYSYMLEGCTSLTTAPALPATTLVQGCYNGMFYGCSSITIAPELPATTLANYCYKEMFNGCSSLNSVTCLATDISASLCTGNWLNGVAQSGTFTKDSSMSSWTTGVNGIPSGWTVEDDYDCSDCDNWMECGYGSYEDCRCEQYGECTEPIDCTDWENMGFSSYEECNCMENGEDCEEPDPCMDVDCADCNNWDNECCAGMYESYEDCDCHMNGNNCPEEEEPEP